MDDSSSWIYWGFKSFLIDFVTLKKNNMKFCIFLFVRVCKHIMNWFWIMLICLVCHKIIIFFMVVDLFLIWLLLISIYCFVIFHQDRVWVDNIFFVVVGIFIICQRTCHLCSTLIFFIIPVGITQKKFLLGFVHPLSNRYKFA